MKAIFVLVISLQVGTSGFAQTFKNPLFDHLRAKKMNEQNREIKSALNLNAEIKEFHLKSNLDGTTTGTLQLKIQLETYRDFHIYKDRLDFAISDSSYGKWKLRLASSPQTVRFLDPVKNEMTEGFGGQGEFQFEAELTQPLARAPQNEDRLQVLTGIQMCNKELCLLPVVIQTELPLTLHQPKKEESFLQNLSRKIKEKVGDSGDFSFWTIAILFLAGILTAFTPCVYPLYPITLGVFSRWSQTAHISPFSLALTYCASMTLSYALLGLFSASTGMIFGSFTQTPFFLIGVGGVILLSSIFFSGLVQIPVPAKLINFIGKAQSPTKSKKSYFMQAGLMGLSLGIVGSPCVGPVLLSLLAWLGAAVGQGGAGVLLKGFVLLAIFGLGMSFPFLVLGHFVLKLHRRPHLSFLGPWAKGIGSILMALSSLFFIVPGIQILRAQNAPQNLEYNYQKLEDYLAQPTGQWTILDFRADWCAACVQMERQTFPVQKVAEQFKNGNWRLIKIDLTKTNPEGQKIAEKMEIISLPSFLFLNPDGKLCRSHSLHEFENADEFLARLERARASCE